MLGVNCVQFFLPQGRKVTLQYFHSLALFSTHILRGKQRTLFLHSFPSGVCKVVGMNGLVRQFGPRIHGNGIKHLAKNFLKACPALPPILLCLLHYALSAPRGKQRTVFLTSREEKSSYSIFFLVLYSARIMLGVNSVQFSLHQGRKVNLQYFLSLALFGTHILRGKQRTLFLTSGKEKSSYSILSLVLYSSRIMLGVKSAQFSLHKGRKIQVTVFSLSCSIPHALC